MSAPVVIRVENLGKRYLLQHQGERSGEGLRHAIEDLVKSPARHLQRWFAGGPSARSDPEEFWALQDVSFEICQGEVVGIIGRNGAGKSTLLKILARITEPTTGRIGLKGRVASLLEVGTGFHPELTGRENIFLNGAILGMSRAEIRAKFDEIIAFAEVEKFLDTPVKRYSSGMYVRLAFAVAAHLEPEILIVDEVLAVGDAEFQKKCLGKMQDVAGEGRTILFVSHNMAAMQALCSRSYLLIDGRNVCEGETMSVIAAYLQQAESMDLELPPIPKRGGYGPARVKDISLVAPARTGEKFDLVLTFDQTLKSTRARVYLVFHDLNARPILFLSSDLSRSPVNLNGAPGACVTIDRMPLTPGRYLLTLSLEVDGVVSDWIDCGIFLTVAYGDFFGSGKLLPPGWDKHAIPLVEHQWSALATRVPDSMRRLDVNIPT